MRILIFNWRDLAHHKAGGAEVYTHEVAKRWVATGHQVTLFTSHVHGAPRRDVVDGVQVVRSGTWLSVYRDAKKYYRDEARGKFDVVIDEVNTRPFMCPTFVDDVPVVALFHQLAKEVWHYELPLPVALLGRHILEPRWLRAYQNTAVLSVSESTAESLRAHDISSVSLIPEGMSMPEFTPDGKKETVPTLVFCGRLASNKRPDHALKAFERVRASIPDAQMWFIGSGPMLKTLKRQSLKGNASGAVTFFGRVSETEKFELMARAHALVATSVREGWGLVVSEAAAVGTPSIGYDVAGLRDSIPASDGVLAAPDPTSLADAIATHLPAWFDIGHTVEAGGVKPWSVVADEILKAIAVVDLREPVLDVSKLEQSPSIELRNAD